MDFFCNDSVYAFNINMRIMHFVFSYCLKLLLFTFTTLPSRNIKNPRAYCLLLFSLMLTTTDNTATLASHYKLNLLDDMERLNEDNEETKEALVASFKSGDWGGKSSSQSQIWYKTIPCIYQNRPQIWYTTFPKKQSANNIRLQHANHDCIRALLDSEKIRTFMNGDIIDYTMTCLKFRQTKKFIKDRSFRHPRKDKAAQALKPGKGESS